LTKMLIQVSSAYDGWDISLYEKESGKFRGRWTWDHEDFEAGVGGEKYFRDILLELGHDVIQEDVS
jgi:hypothetical protein